MDDPGLGGDGGEGEVLVRDLFDRRYGWLEMKKDLRHGRSIGFRLRCDRSSLERNVRGSFAHMEAAIAQSLFDMAPARGIEKLLGRSPSDVIVATGDFAARVDAIHGGSMFSSDGRTAELFGRTVHAMRGWRGGKAVRAEKPLPASVQTLVLFSEGAMSIRFCVDVENLHAAAEIA